MRPPNCFGGNPRAGPWLTRGEVCFNEAAELLRRKLLVAIGAVSMLIMASMRPPNCFGGKLLVAIGAVSMLIMASIEAAELLRRKTSGLSVQPR